LEKRKQPRADIGPTDSKIWTFSHPSNAPWLCKRNNLKILLHEAQNFKENYFKLYLLVRFWWNHHNKNINSPVQHRLHRWITQGSYIYQGHCRVLLTLTEGNLLIFLQSGVEKLLSCVGHWTNKIRSQFSGWFFLSRESLNLTRI